MAIDTAARRRNVSRMMLRPLMIGLSPSSGMDTADRVNAASLYIGITYSEDEIPEEVALETKNSIRRKSGLGPK